jgi:dihydropteroate synthase
VALDALRGALPEAVVSVDTFRPEVARRVVRDYGVDVINDVSGCADPDMAAAVAELGVPYVLTHNPLGLQVNKSASPEEGPDAKPIDVRVAQFFAERLQTLYDLGVADVILDPGFGFGKSMTENYALMAALPRLVRLFPQAPFLIGISRKSMIYRLLDTTPEASLNGTTVLNTVALQAGAHILRVHDVREASEALRITLQLMDSKQPPSPVPL